MQDKTIPIFPLDLVLFPRQELPLRIFEPRYKQLVDDCMIGDGQFGVCLIDKIKSVNGWQSPYTVGTIAKITQCKDVGLDGLQLDIKTMGRNSFKIQKIFPPSIPQPENYDPQSLQGHLQISDMHEKIGTEEKMYIQATVEMIPEIDENISLDSWQQLVNLWKKKVIRQALPQTVEPHTLTHVLEQYYLVTDAPTVDYVYSLAALGAEKPDELQSILQAETMADLIDRVEKLLTGPQVL